MNDVEKNATAQELYNSAMQHLYSGDVEKAEKELLCSLSIVPDTSTLRRLVELALAAGNQQKADELIGKAFALNPRNDKGAFEYAETLIRNGDRSAAETVLSEILDRNPTYRPAEKLIRSLLE